MLIGSPARVKFKLNSKNNFRLLNLQDTPKMLDKVQPRVYNEYIKGQEVTTMKNLHGLARELAIDEAINKKALIEKATENWGLEDAGTIELYLMEDHGESYVAMKRYYDRYRASMAEYFGQ